MSVEWLLPFAFFVIALIYSSVGFGGGSSYLALLALPVLGLAQGEIRATALLCNLVVVGGASVIYLKKEPGAMKAALPYLLAGIPMAFIGGMWKLSDDVFFLLLSASLSVGSILLWMQGGAEAVQEESASADGRMIFGKALTSGSIGFLSGLVGIGGGIFLSPVLHLMRWSAPRRISAIATLFILVNSIAGLLGQSVNGLSQIESSRVIPLMVAVLAGGQLGSRLGAGRFSALYIRRITAIVILAAAIFVARDHWPD